MNGLEPGEVVRYQGRAGFETPVNRGRLILTNRRLIWKRTLSIDPFSDHEVVIRLVDIKRVERQGDAIVLDAGRGEMFLFVDWLPLSVISGYRRTREWLRALDEAIGLAQREARTEA